jgi:DNA-binding MarR family transcriptional regulator
MRTLRRSSCDRYAPTGGCPHGTLVSVWKASIKYRLPVAHEQAAPRTARDALEAVAFGSVAVTSRALAAVGLELTFAQWRVLVVVGENPEEGATVTEIADRLGSEISPVSRLVGRLARRGLVTAYKDHRDRRVTRVRVSDAGREIRDTVIERRRELLAEVLAAAGPIDDEAEAALQRIGVAFRRYT